MAHATSVETSSLLPISTIWSGRSGWLQCAPLMLQTHYQQYTRSSFLRTFPAGTGGTSVDQISLQSGLSGPRSEFPQRSCTPLLFGQTLGKLILSQFPGGKRASVVPSSIKGKVCSVPSILRRWREGIGAFGFFLVEIWNLYQDTRPKSPPLAFIFLRYIGFP